MSRRRTVSTSHQGYSQAANTLLNIWRIYDGPILQPSRRVSDSHSEVGSGTLPGGAGLLPGESMSMRCIVSSFMAPVGGPTAPEVIITGGPTASDIERFVRDTSHMLVFRALGFYQRNCKNSVKIGQN